MYLGILSAIVAIGLFGGDASEAAPADLDRLTARFELVRKVDVATGRETLTGPGFTLIVAPGLSTAILNGSARQLSRPVTISGGKVCVPPELVAAIEKYGVARGISAAPKAGPRATGSRRLNREFRVVLDAGHGGMHTGGKSRDGSLIEKDVTLDVCLRLRKILEAMGVEVIMTRTTDVHFSEEVDDDLMYRVNLSNRSRPDLFLSVHANWHPGSEARGFEVYVSRHLSGIRENSKLFAEDVHTLFKSSLNTEDRGIKEAGFKVIRLTEAPAVLVELEFISNPQGERELGDPAHRQKLAELLGESAWRYATRK